MGETHIPLAPIADRRRRLSRRRALRAAAGALVTAGGIAWLTDNPQNIARAKTFIKDAVMLNAEAFRKPIAKKDGRWVVIDEKDKKIVAFNLMPVPLNTQSNNNVVPLHEGPNINTPAGPLAPPPKTVYFGHPVAGGGYNAADDENKNNVGKLTVYAGNNPYENMGIWYILTDRTGRQRNPEKPEFVMAASVQVIPDSSPNK